MKAPTFCSLTMSALVRGWQGKKGTVTRGLRTLQPHWPCLHAAPFLRDDRPLEKPRKDSLPPKCPGRILTPTTTARSAPLSSRLGYSLVTPTAPPVWPWARKLRRCTTEIQCPAVPGWAQAPGKHLQDPHGPPVQSSVTKAHPARSPVDST